MKVSLVCIRIKGHYWGRNRIHMIIGNYLHFVLEFEILHVRSFKGWDNHLHLALGQAKTPIIFPLNNSYGLMLLLLANSLQNMRSALSYLIG